MLWFQINRISRWECEDFLGEFSSRGKFQLSSLSQWKPTSYLYIWDDVHSCFIPHRKMNVTVKRASASPSLPRCPSIIILFFLLWLFLLFQESTAENATLDPSEGISFSISLSLSLSLSLVSFFSVDVHLYRKIMTCFLGLWVCGGVGTFTSNGGFFQIFS